MGRDKAGRKNRERGHVGRKNVERSARARKLEELRGAVRNMVFIEPEPAAGGAGAVFQACARRLDDHTYTVWRFRPPLDHLFRLSPSSPVHQTVYAFTRDARLLDALRAYADPL